MTLQEFLDDVKAEARLDGDDDFDAMIVGILNEAVLQGLEQQFSHELFDAATLSLSTGDGTVALPSDYLRMNRLRFFTSEGDSWRLHDKEGPVPPAPPGFYGYPKSYSVRGTNLEIEPQTEIDSGDTLSLEYYKRHTTYSAASLGVTVTPHRMIPWLKQTVLKRVLIFHEKHASAQLIGKDEPQAAAGSVVENTPVSDPK